MCHDFVYSDDHFETHTLMHKILGRCAARFAKHMQVRNPKMLADTVLADNKFAHAESQYQHVFVQPAMPISLDKVRPKKREYILDCLKTIMQLERNKLKGMTSEVF